MEVERKRGKMDFVSLKKKQITKTKKQIELLTVNRLITYK